MNVENEIAKQAPKSGRRTVDHMATVKSVSGGVVVNIDGSDADTPCVSEIACHYGDRVRVRIINHKAHVVGNLTTPAVADDEEYGYVKDVAEQADDLLDTIAGVEQEAQDTFDHILESASQAAQVTTRITEYEAEAHQSLENILDSAMAAAGDAAEAKQSATEAKGSAASALQSAKAAQYGLSDVEKVVGTLNWIAEHGSYVNQAGQAFDASKTYYTRSGTSPNYVYTVVAEPVAADIASYYLLTVNESVQNFLASHLWLDNYGLNLSVDSANGYRIHQGTVDGTKAAGMYILDPSGDVVGTFNANGIVLGNSTNGNYAVIDADSFDILHAATQMAHFGYGEGNASGGTAAAPYYTLGTRKTTTTQYSTSSTYEVGAHVLYNGAEYVCISAITTPEAWTASHWQKAVGNYSIAEGLETTASGWSSHAEGLRTTAIGSYSHAEGYGTISSSYSSHAEGNNAVALGMDSHAEGNNTTALAPFSHAEGRETTASNYYSHAEGYKTKASGYRSHAQNWQTIAASYNQTALGKFNVEDANDTYAAIIGNGTADDARHNALAVRWDGLVDDNNGVTGSTVPVGTILDFAGATTPAGYLECDGSAVSRTQYPLLFAALGTTWGAGNGSTTFNIPDLRGRTAIGAGTGTAGGATAHALGSSGGDERMQKHNHGDLYWLGSSSYPVSLNQAGSSGYQLQWSGGAGGGRLSMQDAGGGSSENMQPYAVVKKIIRAV